MFSFHKPRVYRSSEGCCICRAKSSSSRFTDSQKYEEDSMKCFNLKHPRFGEICNACVLLVKRYKRLPEGSQRHWGHVVDARAGPGTKTLTKHKRPKEESPGDNGSAFARPADKEYSGNGKSIITEKFSKIFKKTKKLKLREGIMKTSSNALKTISPLRLHNKYSKRSEYVRNDNQIRDELPVSNTTSTLSGVVRFQTQTRASSYRLKNFSKRITENEPFMRRKCGLSNINGSKRRKKFLPKKNSKIPGIDFPFFDISEWVKRTTCCGESYECVKLPGTLIIDAEKFKPCKDHSNANREANCSNLKTMKTTLPSIVKLNLPLTNSAPAATMTTTTSRSTPVLKKHHLFFKRQSECFPTGDSITLPISSSSSVETTTENLKTDNTDEAKDIKPASTTSSLHSKSSSFLHKIKCDAGKIVKHSIGKLNSAVRLKSQNISDINHLVKTVDKSYLLTKATGVPVLSAHYNQDSQKTSIITTTRLTAADLSPTASSTTSTKFSDNSSDSGFDENDRKSVSPLQQESDGKIITIRPPVQTLILASGVKIHGQQQNLAYAGNEAASKILQNRTQQSIAGVSNTTILAPNQSLNVPSKNCAVFSEASKIRTIFNNSIQHENGITTIVPASSLAASNQTAAMQAAAPNTVTITPAISTTQKRLAITNPININRPNYQKQQPNETNQHLNSLNVNNQNHFNASACASNLNQKIILVKTTAATPGLVSRTGNGNLI